MGLNEHPFSSFFLVWYVDAHILSKFCFERDQQSVCSSLILSHLHVGKSYKSADILRDQRQTMEMCEHAFTIKHYQYGAVRTKRVYESSPLPTKLERWDAVVWAGALARVRRENQLVKAIKTPWVVITAANTPYRKQVARRPSR